MPNCYNPGTNSFDAACPAWFGAEASTASWNYNFAAQPWTQAHTYILASSATDVASNTEILPSSYLFTYDVEAPTATVTVASYINSNVTSIPGTSTDTPSGVATLQIAVSTNGGTAGSWLSGKNGTYTSNVPVYLTTSTYVLGNPDSWTEATANLSLINGDTYYIQIFEEDNAGNSRTQSFPNSFVYDTTLPTIAITQPDTAFYNTPISIEGTSGETPPGYVTQVQIRISTASQDWTGTAWTSATPYWLTVTGNLSSWIYTSTPPWVSGQSYTTYAQATDVAGNVSSPVQSYSFTYAVTPVCGG